MEEWFRQNSLPPQVWAAILAMLIAFIRVMYDQKERKLLRIALESALCGTLSLAFSYGIFALGLDGNWTIFVGGMIGYLGSTTVRGFALKLLDKEIERR